MELALIVFPKPYLSSKASYYLKFKNLRYDLLYFYKDHLVFYQDKKFIPGIDNKCIFDRNVDKIIDEEWLKNIHISYIKFVRDDFVEDYVSFYHFCKSE